MKININILVLLTSLLMAACGNNNSLLQDERQELEDLRAFAEQFGVNKSNLANEENQTFYEQTQLDTIAEYDSIFSNRSVPDTLGGRVTLKNPDSLKKQQINWKRRLWRSKNPDDPDLFKEKVYVTTGHSYGLKTVEEMLGEIDKYNDYAKEKGLPKATGIRVKQYLKRDIKTKRIFVGTYLAPVSLNGTMIHEYTKDNSLAATSLVYNKSNPCPDECGDGS